jgi:hypothetical protein
MTRNIQIRETEDIASALSAGMEDGGLLIDEQQLGGKFFDLSTGLAGEVLQKFVIADAKAHGNRFSELVYEHRSHRAVRFFGSEQLARQWLDYNPVVRC